MKGQSKYVRFFIFSPVLLYSTNAFIIRQKTTIISKRLPTCSIETSLHSDMHNIGGNEGPHNTFNISGKPFSVNDPTFGDNYYFNGSSKPMNINQAQAKIRPQAKQTNAGRTNYIDQGNLNEPTFGDNFPGGSASSRAGTSFRNPRSGNVSQSSSTPTSYGNSSPWNSLNRSDKKKQPSTSFNSSYNQKNVPSYTSSVRNGLPEARKTKSNNFLHADKFSTKAHAVPDNSSAHNKKPVEEPTKKNHLHPGTYLNKANFGENKGYY